MIEQHDFRYFRGLDLHSLEIDQAFVNVTVVSDLAEKAHIYLLSQDCYKCPYKYYGEVSGVNSTLLRLSSHHPWNFKIRRERESESGGEKPPHLLSQFTSAPNDETETICHVMDASLGEFGVYDLRITAADKGEVEGSSCEFVETLPPVNAYLAILYCAVILLALGLAFQLVKFAHKKGFLRPITALYHHARSKLGFQVPIDEMRKPNKSDDIQLKNNNPKKDEAENKTTNGGDEKKSVKQQEQTPKRSRLNSLDVFRGVTIALMIFVNDGAGGYWFFEHATWNGLQLADVVFPWFMWIMGVCIPFSIKSLVKKKTPMGVALHNVWYRSLKLFMLGFIWNTIGWINLAKLRVPGVLQRFSVAYFVVGTSAVLFARSSEMWSNAVGWRKHLKDLVSSWQRWVVAFAILAVHQLVTYLLPVPGCPKGYVGAGGLYDDAKWPGHCTGGAAGYVDRLILGVNHIYSNPTPKHLYQTEAPFDPEGILGSLTTIFQVFLGYQAGQIIVSHQDDKQRLLRFSLWSLLTSLIGIGLCGAARDTGLVPINKNIWSLSFVMVTTGLAYFVMAIIYLVVDVKKWWSGAPFLYAGLNSIVLYLGSYMAYNMLPFNYALSDGMDTHWRKLPESIWGVCCWLMVAYAMFKSKVFVTV